VYEPAQDVASSDTPQIGERSWRTRRRVRRSEVEAAVRPPRVVVGDALAEHPFEMTSTEDERPVQHSVLTVCTHRSAKASALGARIGVRTIPIPSPVKTPSKLLVYMESRSLRRKRNGPYPDRSQARFRACWVTQEESGDASSLRPGGP
jgi:hypothetical protein